VEEGFSFLSSLGPQGRRRLQCGVMDDRMLQVQYWAVLYCSALYWTVLSCTVLYCAVLYCLYCHALNFSVLCCTALYCAEMRCTPVLLTMLHCHALVCFVVWMTMGVPCCCTQVLEDRGGALFPFALLLEHQTSGTDVSPAAPCHCSSSHVSQYCHCILLTMPQPLLPLPHRTSTAD